LSKPLDLEKVLTTVRSFMETEIAAFDSQLWTS
jgi:hypothetical protein